MPNTNQRAFLASIVVAVSLMGCAQETSSTSQSTKAAKVPTTNAAEMTSRPDVRDIAGVELGKKIVIPECKKEKAYGIVMYATDNMSYPCFTKMQGAGNSLKTAPDLPHGPQYNGANDVELGPTAVPAGVSPTADIVVIDGVPELVTLKTEGIEQQKRLYTLLVEKYGTPTQSNISQLQNAMGTRYQSIEASWQLKSMTVTFEGMLDSPREGYITASTKKYAKWYEDRQPKSSNTF